MRVENRAATGHLFAEFAKIPPNSLTLHVCRHRCKPCVDSCLLCSPGLINKNAELLFGPHLMPSVKQKRPRFARHFASRRTFLCTGTGFALRLYLLFARFFFSFLRLVSFFFALCKSAFVPFTAPINTFQIRFIAFPVSKQAFTSALLAQDRN